MDTTKEDDDPRELWWTTPPETLLGDWEGDDYYPGEDVDEEILDDEWDPVEANWDLEDLAGHCGG